MLEETAGGGGIRADEGGGRIPPDTVSGVKRTGLAGYVIATAHNLAPMADLLLCQPTRAVQSV